TYWIALSRAVIIPPSLKTAPQQRPVSPPQAVDTYSFPAGSGRPSQTGQPFAEIRDIISERAGCRRRSAPVTAPVWHTRPRQGSAPGHPEGNPRALKE